MIPAQRSSDSRGAEGSVLFGNRSRPQAAAARTVGAFELRAAEMEAKHKREVRHDMCERVYARARLHMCVYVWLRCGAGAVQAAEQIALLQRQLCEREEQRRELDLKVPFTVGLDR